jgi:hypothetical protein
LGEGGESEGDEGDRVEELHLDMSKGRMEDLLVVVR